MEKTPDLPECCAEALGQAMQPEFFKALCDPVRISIVATLATRSAPICVSDVAECCGVDFSGVSRHLKILKEAGVVSSSREGRMTRYRLDADMLATTLRAMAEAVEKCRQNASEKTPDKASKKAS